SRTDPRAPRPRRLRRRVRTPRESSARRTGSSPRRERWPPSCGSPPAESERTEPEHGHGHADLEKREAGDDGLRTVRLQGEDSDGERLAPGRIEEDGGLEIAQTEDRREQPREGDASRVKRENDPEEASREVRTVRRGSLLEVRGALGHAAGDDAD